MFDAETGQRVSKVKTKLEDNLQGQQIAADEELKV